MSEKGNGKGVGMSKIWVERRKREVCKGWDVGSK